MLLLLVVVVVVVVAVVVVVVVVVVVAVVVVVVVVVVAVVVVFVVVVVVVAFAYPRTAFIVLGSSWGSREASWGHCRSGKFVARQLSRQVAHPPGQRAIFGLRENFPGLACL